MYELCVHREERKKMVQYKTEIAFLPCRGYEICHREIEVFYSYFHQLYPFLGVISRVLVQIVNTGLDMCDTVLCKKVI